MGKYLDLHGFARRADDALLPDALDDAPYLLEAEFACQHDHIGKGGKELYGGQICHIGLNG